MTENIFIEELSFTKLRECKFGDVPVGSVIKSYNNYYYKVDLFTYDSATDVKKYYRVFKSNGIKEGFFSSNALVKIVRDKRVINRVKRNYRIWH